jgi:hypothetical protein
MKMFFSLNKRGVIKNNQNNKETIKEYASNHNTSMNEQRELFNAAAYSFKYGMFARIENSSKCSSCGK